jgi:hypothetical protein
MLTTANEPTHEALEFDGLGAAMRRLKSRLPLGTDSEVLIDLLSDDLEQGLTQVADVENHFSEIVEALSRESLSAVRLVELSENLQVLDRLEHLNQLAQQIRRRLSQAAGKIRWGR